MEVAFRADHTEPRSSARPTAPGTMSSSGMAISPTSESTSRPGLSSCSHFISGLRNKASEATESTENRRNWNQAGPASPNRCRPPMARAAMPKKMT